MTIVSIKFPAALWTAVDLQLAQHVPAIEAKRPLLGVIDILRPQCFVATWQGFRIPVRHQHHYMLGYNALMLELPHTAGCLVCGRHNPIGLHLHLHVDESSGAVATNFT